MSNPDPALQGKGATAPESGPGGPADGTDLDQQIESLLQSIEPAQDAELAGGTAVGSPAGPGTTSEQGIGALDADLARLTDTLLSTDAPLPAAAEPGAPAPSPSPQAAPAGVVSPPTAPPVPSAAPTAPESASVVASAGAPGQPGADRRSHGSLGSQVARLGGSVGRAAAPALLSALSAASRPLSQRPKVVRDTVGWLALWTVFLSVSLWTYLLFFHKPETPRTDRAPIEIVDQGGKGARPVATAAHGDRGADQQDKNEH